MPTKDAVTKKDRQLRTSEDWVVSKRKRFRANIIVWGMPTDLTTLKIRAKLADLGLASFVWGNVLWDGDHVFLPKIAKHYLRSWLEKYPLVLGRLAVGVF